MISIDPSADKISRMESNSFWELCELEIYGHAGSECKKPPEDSVLNGWLSVNRKKADLSCLPPQKPEIKLHKYLKCNNRKWIQIGNHKCKGKVQNSSRPEVIEIAVIVGASCLVVICLLVIFVVCKKRNNSVIVMVSPQGNNCFTSTAVDGTSQERTEYSTVNYEEISLPELPKRNFGRIPLPHVFTEYLKPADSIRIPKLHEEEDSKCGELPEYFYPQDSIKPLPVEQYSKIQKTVSSKGRGKGYLPF